jgi:predicted outer membrane repeat protein
MTDGTIIDNTAGHDGGGVYVLQGTCVLSGGIIAENTAEYGSGVYIDATDSDNPVDFEMTGGLIRDNRAKQSGGGIFMLNGTLTMRGNGAVKGNTALSGGGVCLENSDFRISGSASIQNNTITGNGNGGGIYVSTGALDFAGGLISGNRGIYGGGIYGFDCDFTMKGNTVVTGNTADNSGGGIFLSNGTFEMTNGEILGNTAHNAGGGIYAGDYCTILLEGGSISGNQSIKEGGGVDIKAHAIVTLTGVVINSNRAEKGGGVHIWQSGVFNMWNNLLKPEGGALFGNQARSGGGVYVDAGGVLTKNSGIVSENIPNDIQQEE